MAVSNTYIRQRSRAIQEFQIPEKDFDTKEVNRLKKQLRWGFVNEKIKPEFDAFAKAIPINQKGELWLKELAAHSSWFLLHPEKMAGKEVATTSFMFPVTIKGTKQDVLQAIDRTLKGKQPNKDKKLKLLRLRARAARARLTLLTIKQ